MFKINLSLQMNAYQFFNYYLEGIYLYMIAFS